MKKGKSKNNGLLPSSLRIISSCLKTVSTNVSTVASSVRSSAASITSVPDDHKDQVTWAGFDILELHQSNFKRILLLGYLNGFQVFDVHDASSFSELVSKRDGPVYFLQMQPFPVCSDGQEGFVKSHPLLLVVAGDDTGNINHKVTHSSGLGRDGKVENQSGNSVNSATTVRFYSLKSHSYVHILRFRSAVCMIRCSSQIVAVGLATQIYCFDALTLESKFSVLINPVPQLAVQGSLGVNVGYGPMAVGPRWLAYASNNPLPSNVGCMSPQNLSPSPGVSPSSSPGSGSLVARYAMESSKNLAAGIIKYCHELLPDGSNSPVPSNLGWKVGRVMGADKDNAGMVIVKDFVSRAIISQFKAHSGPISALCFDPSGTLLVTASVYGNNINIFRIMPSCTRKGSGVPGYDWCSSHVHLYRLHRGITPAMIQDICFSQFSQWIAIVSSKGTCHLFVLSPFGGDTGFKIINSQGEEPSLLPVFPLPWWFTSSSTSYEHPLPPPAPSVLSVVSRIKYSSFGWLNTVHSSTSNVTGKVFVPSGAIAAVFHNSLSHSQHLGNSKVKPLEHLMVYTPSGHIVQHQLLPSVGPEPSECGSRTQSASNLRMQEDEFRVKVEPIQWWDVCRRSEWPEKWDPCGNTVDGQDGIDSVQEKICSVDGHGLDFWDISHGVGEKVVKHSTGKSQERFHGYLSNAEVQVNFGRLQLWEKPKIYFYAMNSMRTSFSDGGEFEIEKISSNKVEIRRKELLPVFDHFHSIRPSWNERGHAGGKYLNLASPVHCQAEDRQTADMTVICHSKPASLSSTESSDGGSSRRIENLIDLDQISPSCLFGEVYLERMGAINVEPSLQNKIVLENSSLFGNLKHDNSQYDHCLDDRPLLQGSKITYLKGDTLEDVGISEASTFVLKHDSDKSEPIEVTPVMQNACDSQSFPDSQCKTPRHKGGNVLTEVVDDDVDSSSSHHEIEQPEEDGENDELLGGLFPFSD
ncbi:putative transcription factor WD40-like family [Lupinus albus]|uniref:Putative transcription factor WD40-like family n=1 Tax=Lupinus albus TaxID=3870 RepID=A0A6A4QCI5_LUPAL|nr:putative transcription factor WD40-like family [Lupinus albus]